MHHLRFFPFKRHIPPVLYSPTLFACLSGTLRYQSTLSASQFRESVTKPTSKYQIYISSTRDPYTNLSIEHFLLQNSPADSTILFLYVNRPCIVIGRNQNPWLEADLKLVRKPPAFPAQDYVGQQGSNKILLVRRRSGGGTVFHDEGNVNYSVICPTAEFTRDKHVEMVVQAIRKANPRARVNERHDVVIDQGGILAEGNRPRPNDMHRTAYASGGVAPLKVSGSAYKLTRQRSLHHGTCLLASPNLEIISRFLDSPAKPFMKARGVESVRSPIGNVYEQSDHVVEDIVSKLKYDVVEAFSNMYSICEEGIAGITQPGISYSSLCSHQISGYVNDELARIPEIQAGIEELKSQDWIFGQTPQFILSSHASEEDDRVRPPLPKGIPSSARVYLKVRAGVITSSKISLSALHDEAIDEVERFHTALKEKNIQEIHQFQNVLGAKDFPRSEAVANMSSWLDAVFGK